MAVPDEQTGLDQFRLTRPLIVEVLRLTCANMQEFNRRFVRPYEVRLGNKNMSEILGKVLETNAAIVFSRGVGYEVRKESSDQDPDLLFTRLNRPLEVKVTSTSTGWTGGEFSKRPFDYLLISWDKKSLYDSYFAALVHLEKPDWESRMAKDYYGPSFTVRRLAEKKNRIDFVGSIGKGTRGGIRLFWENVLSDPSTQVRLS